MINFVIMHIDEIREYCLSKKEVDECLPFDDETLVFKIMGKIFVLLNINKPFSINLKCNPEKAIELRENYDFVTPGYHMNKKHWNTIKLDSFVPDKLLKEWIDDSYNIVLKGFSAKRRKEKGFM